MAERFSRLDRKVVQGATVAAAATAGAIVAVAAIHSDSPSDFVERLGWAAQSDIYTSVGLPSFVAGALFFPVGLRALSSRGWFAAKAAATAAAVSVVNRVLVWASYERPDSLWDGLGELWARPELLWPAPLDVVALGLDWNGLLGLTATALTGALAWAAQPLLRKIARGPRLGPIAEFEASSSARPLRRVRAR